MVRVSKWTLGTLLTGLAVGALGVACEAGRPEREATEEQTQSPSNESAAEAQPTRAVAQLMPKSGSDLSGEATFVKEDNGDIKFEVDIQGVSPGMHAVHIHENGDCSAEDASSAGGHWNPTNEEHGRWGVHPFHLGDIGNIDVDKDGKGTLSLTTDLWSLKEGDPHSVLGHSVVVHAGADDFKTQPSGAAGARIGCGVIELKKQT